MSDLIPLEDAARILGLPVEKLNEMRSNSEIFGYKDGATSWKFKMQELERVADELGITLSTDAAPADEPVQAEFELELDDDDDLSFDLASDDDAVDLKLEDDDDFELSDGGAAAEVVAEEADEELSFGSSDINLAASDSDVNLLDDDEPGKGDPSTGKLLDDGGNDDLLLSEEDLFEDELTIQESHEDSIDLSSDFEDSSDLIMDDSDSSADVEAVVADDDSAIVLSEDSGDISLSGSGLMELAEDDEMIVLDEPADPNDPTQVQDDDFNLTPLEESMDEESSGSQIIALEDSEMYSDESAATLLSPSDELEAEPLLSADALDVADFEGFDTGAGMAPGMGVIPGSSQSLPESPYTVAQVVSLGLVLFLLSVGGMVGYDLARNLWLPEDQIISSGVLRFILSLVGG